MDKKVLSAVFDDIALLLELKGENPFKIKAYTNAARVLELLDEDIDDLIRQDRLEDIKGIGKAIADKIREFAATGHLGFYEELKSKVPESILDMLKIPGVGPKKVKLLYEKLNIKSIGELEYACIENRLLSIEGFGKKTQENILKGIEHIKKFKGQYLYGDVCEQAQEVLNMLNSSGMLYKCEITGSLRRKKEVVKDIDMVASAENPQELVEYFTSLPMVEEVGAKGDTKAAVRLKCGINMDLRIVKDFEFPYVLNHFTGSKEHNTAVRHRAKAMGIKVNEYGLFRGDELIKCRSEEDIYNTLGLAYIPPELRENNGEIEAAEEKRLPVLINAEDIRGLFHIHTTYSDGSNTIEEYVSEAVRMGMDYIGITDHSRSAYYARGLSNEELKRQLEEIDSLNFKHKGFRIFKGIESDILPDGSLDYDEDMLKEFDFVIASVHSGFKLPGDKMTERLISSLKNKYTTMLGHLTGRILLAREAYELDIHAVIDAAAKYNKIIEINADPHRLDLDWRYLKYAREKGVKLSINPDAHNIYGLRNYRYGVGIARKGWLESGDVINTLSRDEIISRFREVKYENC
ncbi:MAG: DNA polymerase/3'-5' exonuclease PolX [Bacillota bacterium]